MESFWKWATFSKKLEFFSSTKKTTIFFKWNKCPNIILNFIFYFSTSPQMLYFAYIQTPAKNHSLSKFNGPIFMRFTSNLNVRSSVSIIFLTLNFSALIISIWNYVLYNIHDLWIYSFVERKDINKSEGHGLSLLRWTLYGFFFFLCFFLSFMLKL